MRLYRFTLGFVLAGNCWLAAATQDQASPTQVPQPPSASSSVVTPSSQPAQSGPLAPQNLVVAGPHTMRQLGMVNLPGSPGFDAAAIANGKLLLTQTDNSTLDIFDPALRRIVAQVVDLQSPRGIGVDQQHGLIYVAQAGNNSVAVISFEGWQVKHVIPLPQSPTTLLLDDSGNLLYWASASNNALSILDINTRQNLGTVDLGGRPRGMAWDAQRNVAFVALQDQNEIVAVDKTLQVVSRFKLNASQPTGIVYDPRARRLYVAARGAVLAINDQDGSETSRVQAPAGVDGLWLDPQSRTVYAASPGQLLVVRASDTGLTAVDKIPSDIKGHTVACDPESQMVFLPGGREGRSAVLLLQPMSSAQSGDQHNPAD